MKNLQLFWYLLVIIQLRVSVQLLSNDVIKLKSMNEQNISNLVDNYIKTENSTEKNSLSNNADEKQPNNRGYPQQMYAGKPRNNYRLESNSNKMDRTIIGAIIIGCIFLFITLSITITIIIFCLKKNTVFVFQKSEQEDIHDCTYEDCLDSISYQSSLHCDDHRLSACNSVNNVRRNLRNQKNYCEYFNRCPVELFYPMHYDRPYPIQFTHVRKPSHKRCQCHSSNQKCRNSTTNINTSNKCSDSETEHLPWHKIHEGSTYKPLFKESNLPNTIVTNPTDIKIKIDLISQNRQVTANVNSNNDKPLNDDGPLLQEYIENTNMQSEKDSSTKIILTPLGKSQTYTELNPLQKMSISTNDDNETVGSSKRLHKSRSNYDSSISTKRTL